MTCECKKLREMNEMKQAVIGDIREEIEELKKKMTRSEKVSSEQREELITLRGALIIATHARPNGDAAEMDELTTTGHSRNCNGRAPTTNAKARG
ncbi:MAG: hypothetical protein GY854_19725 [Deltaproteobacteria bacterium]|nr:hypothetical protein [Deltaproteobacteria bacterium]